MFYNIFFLPGRIEEHTLEPLCFGRSSYLVEILLSKATATSFAVGDPVTIPRNDATPAETICLLGDILGSGFSGVNNAPQF